MNPRIEYTGGDRGWIGDNPFIFLRYGRDSGAGLDAAAVDPQGVERTVEFLRSNEWVLEQRT